MKISNSYAVHMKLIYKATVTSIKKRLRNCFRLEEIKNTCHLSELILLGLIQNIKRTLFRYEGSFAGYTY